MISFLRGVIRGSSLDTAVIEAGGIGYKVFVPSGTCASLPKEGREVILFTHLVVKEDHFALYGFVSEGERDLFVLLLGVSGLGPKAALSLLGSLGMERVYQAIIQEDLKMLTVAPGVGPKSAQRLVFELKEKVSEQFPFVLNGLKHETGAYDEALEALTSLGYTASEASSALKNVQEDSDNMLNGVELTKQVLRYLSSR